MISNDPDTWSLGIGHGRAFADLFASDAETGKLPVDATYAVKGEPDVSGRVRSPAQALIHETADGNRIVANGIGSCSRWRSLHSSSRHLESGCTYELLSTGAGGLADSIPRYSGRVLEGVLDEHLTVEAPQKTYESSSTQPLSRCQRMRPTSRDDKEKG